MSSFLKNTGVGVGLKPQHYQTILSTQPAVDFFEIHAENYMEDGGPPHHYLTAVAENYPLSLHGVGLSIGGESPLDGQHLKRLCALNLRYSPALFSEHLAWSTHEGIYFNDLLPLPYTPKTLEMVCAHIGQVQDAMGRQMLLENPSRYAALSQSTFSEITFLEKIVEKTGCGLLLDLNNVYISAHNLGISAGDYVRDFPLESVGEIHLAGHEATGHDDGASLLLDTHDRSVALDVWSLFALFLKLAGPRPTLIEWDSDIPTWSVLEKEALKARSYVRCQVPGGQVSGGQVPGGQVPGISRRVSPVTLADTES